MARRLPIVAESAWASRSQQRQPESTAFADTSKCAVNFSARAPVQFVEEGAAMAVPAGARDPFEEDPGVDHLV